MGERSLIHVLREPKPAGSIAVRLICAMRRADRHFTDQSKGPSAIMALVCKPIATPVCHCRFHARRRDKKNQEFWDDNEEGPALSIAADLDVREKRQQGLIFAQVGGRLKYALAGSHPANAGSAQEKFAPKRTVFPNDAGRGMANPALCFLRRRLVLCYDLGVVFLTL